MTIAKKQIWGLITYIVIIAAYLSLAITEVRQWRQNNINNSPTVYFTRTGEKYHEGYHYHDRNYSFSLFEANEKGYSPCGICHPPIAPMYSDKPGFYIYNWFLISIAFTFVYWIVFIHFIQKI